MDRYDLLVLEVIHTQRASKLKDERICLKDLEEAFWESVKNDSRLNVGHGRIGERIARLYLDGFIENKNGYRITRRARAQLQAASQLESVA